MKVGQVVGRWYRIDAQIGSGMSSTVWRATDTRAQTNVAIKALHPHLLAEPEYANRFRREGRIDVDHPNVVQVFDDGAEGDDVFIVMEYVAGGTLAGVIEQGPLPPVRALAIVRDIAAALAAAHAKKITHRDVKPRNVLMTPDGHAKLSDFGIARLNESTTFTQTGVFLGTARYSAPEAFSGHAEHRSDLYSLGVILYELVTGRTPFESDTPLAIMQQHQTEAPPAIAEIARRDPRAAWIAERLLEKRPEDRFQSAQQLIEVLDGDATTVPLGRRRPRRRSAGGAGLAFSRGWRYVAVGVAAMLAIAATVGGITITSNGGDGANASLASGDGAATPSTDAAATATRAAEEYIRAVATQQALAFIRTVATQEANAAATAQANLPAAPPVRTELTAAPPPPTATPIEVIVAPPPPPLPTSAAAVCGGTDFDRDGVCDAGDSCPNSPSTWLPADANGCAQREVDFDIDGVCDPDHESTGPNNCTGSDVCPNSPSAWLPADANGCAQREVDFDIDGVCDSDHESTGPNNCIGIDLCPNTPAAWRPVDENGCAALEVSAPAPRRGGALVVAGSAANGRGYPGSTQSPRSVTRNGGLT